MHTGVVDPAGVNLRSVTRGSGNIADHLVPASFRRPNGGLNLENNKVMSRLREDRVAGKLRARFGADNVLSERLLRDARGNIVRDPLTRTGRRIDFLVLDDAGNARYSIEVTSRNQVRIGGKAKQALREARIREAGGVFVRDPRTGQLVDVSGIVTRTMGVEPR